MKASNTSRFSRIIMGLILIFLLIGTFLPTATASAAPAGVAKADSSWFNQGRVCNYSSVSIQILLDKKGKGWQNVWVSPGACMGQGGDDAEGIWALTCWITSRTRSEIRYSCDIRAFKISGRTTAKVYDSWYDSKNPISSQRRHLRVDGASSSNWRGASWPQPSWSMSYTID